jgi:hypothetical protein
MARLGRGCQLKLVEDYPALYPGYWELHFPGWYVLDFFFYSERITIGLLHDEFLLHIHDLTVYTPYHMGIIISMNKDPLIV